MPLDFVYINKKKIPITDWSFTVFQLCDNLGIKIPRFCYHEKLSIAGNCRMCLVELESSIKPIIACATPLSKNMSIITNSWLVKKCRENVIEFLLINHPLDCPICDQGGECDLQDQSIIYGADKGRFNEIKRSVEDKDFGPIIKTVMTRCIHCTRCVRFFEEISGSYSLGTMGRGKETEISMYVSSNSLISEISGNVIDLCPVGALTSKPYAFLARPWELQSYESIDIYDSLNSNIRIDLKGYEIVRILPLKNELFNEEWITDIARYSFDGLKNQRMSMPVYLQSNSSLFIKLSWSSFYDLFLKSYMKLIINFSGFNVSLFNLGSSLDLYSTYLISYLTKYINSYYYIKNENNISSFSFLNRSNYILPLSLNTLEEYDTLFICGLNLKKDYSLINSRLRKRLNLGVLTNSYYFGINQLSNLNYNHSSLSLVNLFNLFKGKNLLSLNLLLSKKIGILHNNLFLKENNNFFKKIVCFFAKKQIIFNNVSLINKNSNIHLNELAIDTISSNSLTKLQNEFNFIYSLDSDFNLNLLKKDSSSIFLYQNTHMEINQFNLFIQNNKALLDSFNFIFLLPVSSYLEEKLPFINLLGYIQWTKKVVDEYSFVQSYKNVLFQLLSILYYEFNKKDLLETYIQQLFIDKVPHLLSEFKLESFILFNHLYLNLNINTFIYFDQFLINNSLFVNYSNTINQVNKLKQLNECTFI